MSSIEPTSIDIRRYKCTFENCTAAFKRQDHLINHERIHTGEKSFKCPKTDCSAKFRTEYHLTRHISEVHDRPESIYFECTVCHERYPRNQQLRQHLKEQHHIPPYTCPYPNCGKQFPSQSKVDRHAESHSRAYICTEPGCFKKFDYLTYRNHRAYAHTFSPRRASKLKNIPPNLLSETPDYYTYTGASIVVDHINGDVNNVESTDYLNNINESLHPSYHEFISSISNHKPVTIHNTMSPSNVLNTHSNIGSQSYNDDNTAYISEKRNTRSQSSNVYCTVIPQTTITTITTSSSSSSSSSNNNNSSSNNNNSTSSIDNIKNDSISNYNDDDDSSSNNNNHNSNININMKRTRRKVGKENQKMNKNQTLNKLSRSYNINILSSHSSSSSSSVSTTASGSVYSEDSDHNSEHSSDSDDLNDIHSIDDSKNNNTIMITPTTQLSHISNNINNVSNPSIKDNVLMADNTISTYDEIMTNKKKYKLKKQEKYICTYLNCTRSYSSAKVLREHVMAVHDENKPFICPYRDCQRGFGWKCVLDRHIKAVHILSKRPRFTSRPYKLKSDDTSLHSTTTTTTTTTTTIDRREADVLLHKKGLHSIDKYDNLLHKNIEDHVKQNDNDKTETHNNGLQSNYEVEEIHTLHAFLGDV